MVQRLDTAGAADYDTSISTMEVSPVAMTVQVNVRRLLADKEVRENRRYSQLDVAEATGLSRQTIAPWLDGSVQAIRLDTLAAICGFLECTPGDVLTLVSQESEAAH